MRIRSARRLPQCAEAVSRNMAASAMRRQCCHVAEELDASPSEKATDEEYSGKTKKGTMTRLLLTTIRYISFRYICKKIFILLRLFRSIPPNRAV